MRCPVGRSATHLGQPQHTDGVPAQLRVEMPHEQDFRSAKIDDLTYRTHATYRLLWV
jgi:hypothetical protein